MKKCKIPALLFAACACICLAGCGRSAEPLPQLDTNVVQSTADELAFVFTIDELIASYNALYSRENQADYLPLAAEWDKSIVSYLDGSAESDYYWFTEDEDSWLLPSISAYTPRGSGQVEKIAVDFNDHLFRQDMYDLYREQCCYLFKSLLSGVDDEQIARLFEAVFAKASDTLCFVDGGEQPLPRAIYCSDSVGIYPYFRTGTIRICLVPITEQYLEQLSAEGAEIYDISDL